ncbi:MAG: prepilin-type N-terminal cleavage/methylation domain-containing protein [Agathobacter sp.]|nr:prepilin-type N-terminal cleavage/methylation domain-containing protein [Agathobacter sp.]
MKKDNRGITLVELVVAISMAVIVMGAATLFIRSAVNGYRKASDTIDLQMESQVVMEQVSTWIMEGNNVKVIEGNNLVIYSIPHKVDPLKLPTGASLWTQTASKRVLGVVDGNLYMKTFDGISDVETDTNAKLVASDAELENCIGEHVVEFVPTIDPNNPDEIQIYLKFQLGKEEYEITDTVKVRNELRDK